MPCPVGPHVAMPKTWAPEEHMHPLGTTLQALQFRELATSHCVYCAPHGSIPWNHTGQKVLL